jgi:hypothetical protein
MATLSTITRTLRNGVQYFHLQHLRGGEGVKRRNRVLVVGMLTAAMLVTSAVPAHADGNLFCTWFPNRCGDTRRSDADRFAIRAAHGMRRATRATVQTAGPIFHNAAQPLREASRADLIDPWEGPFERDGVRERRGQHRRWRQRPGKRQRWRWQHDPGRRDRWRDGRSTHRRWKHGQGQRQGWRHGRIRRHREGGRHHRLRPQYIPGHLMLWSGGTSGGGAQRP